MPITYTKKTAALSGHCTVEEAEELLAWLQKTPAPKVNLASCEHLHAAVLQALLAAKPTIIKAPTAPFLVEWVMPLFADQV